MINLVGFENVQVDIPRLKHVGRTNAAILQDTFVKSWMPLFNQQIVNAALGIAPFKSASAIGSGLIDLVYLPVKQYQQDGRVLMGLQNGFSSLFETTTTESLELGAKIVLKTHELLKYVESMISKGESVSLSKSKYSNQPSTMGEGFLSGLKALQQDMNDSIVAIKLADQEGQLTKAIPIIIIKPLLGLSDVLGKTLLGMRNQMQPEHKKMMDDKYK